MWFKEGTMIEVLSIVLKFVGIHSRAINMTMIASSNEMPLLSQALDASILGTS